MDAGRRTPARNGLSMKVLLVNPPYSRLRGTKECTEMVTPIGLSYIGAYLKSRGIEAALYDANYSAGERLPRFDDVRDLLGRFDRYAENIRSEEHPVWRECRSRLEAARPDVVGVSVLSPVRGAAFRVAEICKRIDPGIRVVFGGYHPSGFPEDVLAAGHVDAVVRGEGEITFAELVERFGRGAAIGDLPGVSYIMNGAARHNTDAPVIEDLDTLPYTTDFLIGAVTGKVPLQYGRGCPYGCKFCADHIMWKRRTRFRSAEHLVGEIEAVIRRTGIREFTFIDGTFNISRERVSTFCEIVIRRKLRIRWDALVRADNLDSELLRMCRKAGCVQLNIGVESGSDRVLEDLKKRIDLKNIKNDIERIKRNRIAAVSFFCIGMPPETPDDLRKTRDLIARLKHDYVILHIFTPFPGTEYYEELEAAGVIGSGHDFDAFGYKSPSNFFATNMPKEEFFRLRDEIIGNVEKVNRDGHLALKLLVFNLAFYLRYPGQLWRRIIRLMGF